MAGYIGAKVGTVTANAADIKGDISSTDTSPDLTLKNTTQEDSDGGRESTITFKGEQSGGEESTLAEIRASHDGTSDDEAGDLIFKTNDGSDGASPTERMRIDSAGEITLTGNIANTSGNFTLDVDGDIILDADGADVVLKDGGTSFGRFTKSGDNFVIESQILNGDLIISGNDGGSPVSALTFDMSDGGTATFNHDIFLAANGNVGVNASNAIQFTSSSKAIVTLGGNEISRFLDTGGITFNGDTAAANALDDYEEGTWTPTIQSGTLNNIAQATYTKIGNVCHCQCKVGSFSDYTSGNSFELTGMPFNFFSFDRSAISTSVLAANVSGINDANGYLENGNKLRLYASIPVGGYDNLRHVDLGSGAVLYIGFSYFTT